MAYMWNIFVQLLDRCALLFACLFLITRMHGFRSVFQKDSYTRWDYGVICAVFSVFSIVSNYTGLHVDGSLVNTRTITIVSGGLLFGPVVGIITGVISGLHRFLIDINGVTSLPCLISSICAGVISGCLHSRTPRSWRWLAAILAGMFSELVTMILILLLSRPHSQGSEIVSTIALPMILPQVSAGLIVVLVQGIEDDKERIAAMQSKLTLDIANKTLPYFREINETSLMTICGIIREEIQADAVSITDTKHILAYTGVGAEYYNIGHEIITPETKLAVSSGEMVIKNRDFHEKTSQLKSAIVIPLKEKNEVTGALKIYYRAAGSITSTVQVLAVGLSQIISTQMELSRLEELREMAGRAERKALQAQINPHFLFNALNAIASLIRISPGRARELIINLSSYLRFNLELSSEFIDLSQELEQVRNYVAIEKARFGDRLNVVYEIDDVAIKIPSLTIQPLVENAIVHGVLGDHGKGTVRIIVREEGERVRIVIEDSGVGIDEDVIRAIQEDRVPERKIGLSNVNRRLKLLYGQGLFIERLTKGTRITFWITKGQEEAGHEGSDRR